MDWNNIKTARQLKTWLLNQANDMQASGYSALADKWSNRIERMPSYMNKESINYVLLAASWEKQRAYSR